MTTFLLKTFAIKGFVVVVVIVIEELLLNVEGTPAITMAIDS